MTERDWYQILPPALADAIDEATPAYSFPTETAFRSWAESRDWGAGGASETVQLMYLWTHAGYDLRHVEPLVASGIDPVSAEKWLRAGLTPHRIAAWISVQDLDSCLRWNSQPQVTASDAAVLEMYDMGPGAPLHPQWRGVPLPDVVGWLERLRDGVVRPADIRGWVSEGLNGHLYLAYGLAGDDGRPPMSLTRFRRWRATGLPARHIRAYENAGVPPSLIDGHGTALGLASEPVEYVIQPLGYGPEPDSFPDDPGYIAERLFHYSTNWLSGTYSDAWRRNPTPDRSDFNSDSDREDG